MPHQCTDCGRDFVDGSKQMLSGCPDCGGTTFQFRPAGDGADPDERPPDPGSDPDPEPDPELPGGPVARTVGSAANAVREVVGSTPDPPGTDESGTEPADADEPTTGENSAQASARTEVVSADELPAGPTAAGTDPGNEPPDGTDTPAADRSPGGEGRALADLRAELNDQFESIRVVEPGQYELNLMELYDREEYIVALQEDGKYTIQVPERWQNG